ncbi:MAG: hypothetical protein ACSHXF_03800 [Aquaticitalea sp.]
MNFHIKAFTISLLFFCTSICVAQQESQTKVERSDTIAANMRNFRPRLFALSLNGYAPIPSGDKFVGQAFDGKFGFNFKAQMMIYKQFFINLGLGQTYFDVNNINSIGNYRSTAITSQYVSIGYEFLPLDKVRLGLGVGILGRADYSNKFSEGLSVVQRDTAKLNIYELYMDYEIFYFMAVTFNYAYRNDKTKIDVPQELQSNFERAQFHTVGLGVKFYLGDNNLFH